MFYSTEIKLPEELIETITSQPRILITGGLGTGKSLLAEEFAKRIIKKHWQLGEFMQIVDGLHQMIPSEPEEKSLVLMDNINVSGYSYKEIMDVLTKNGVNAILTIPKFKHFFSKGEGGLNIDTKEDIYTGDYLMVTIVNNTKDAIEISVEDKQYTLQIECTAHDMGLNKIDDLDIPDLLNSISLYGDEHLKEFLLGFEAYLKDPTETHVYVFRDKVDFHPIPEGLGHSRLPDSYMFEAPIVVKLSAPDTYGRIGMLVEKHRDIHIFNGTKIRIRKHSFPRNLLDLMSKYKKPNKTITYD